MKVDPEPVVQLVPLLVLYSQVALSSMPLTLMVPTLVTPSELLAPLSVAREKAGALGAAVSTVREMLLVLTVLPAASLTTARN